MIPLFKVCNYAEGFVLIPIANGAAAWGGKHVLSNTTNVALPHKRYTANMLQCTKFLPYIASILLISLFFL